MIIVIMVLLIPKKVKPQESRGVKAGKNGAIMDFFIARIAFASLSLHFLFAKHSPIYLSNWQKK
jgi:hypothetical protein